MRKKHLIAVRSILLFAIAFVLLFNSYVYAVSEAPSSSRTNRQPVLSFSPEHQYFPIDLRLLSELNRKRVPINLRQEFESYGNPLSSKVGIAVEVENTLWRVTDEETNMTYFIQRRADDLMVYRFQPTPSLFPYLVQVAKRNGRFVFSLDSDETYSDRIFPTYLKILNEWGNVRLSLLQVPDGVDLDFDLLYYAGHNLDNVIFTRDYRRAAEKLQDPSFFSTTKKHANLIDGSTVATEYKAAVQFLNLTAPQTTFAIVATHADGDITNRFTELVNQGIFKDQHVLLRICWGDPANLQLPAISRILLDHPHAGSARSVTYAAQETVSVPFSVLEMFYLATHPQMLSQTGVSNSRPVATLPGGTITPDKIIGHIDDELRAFINHQPRRQEFVRELASWWHHSTYTRTGDLPLEIRNLIEQLYKDIDDLKRSAKQRLKSFPEVQAPFLFNSLYG